MKALGVIQFNSIGAGYLALNMAGRMTDLEVLEFSPLGDFSQILVQGDSKKVNSYIVELRTGDIVRSLCLNDFDEKILRSYLSLDNSKIQNYVLVIEAKFSGDLFQAAMELKKLGLSTVDFRVFRTSGSPGYLSMTGSSAAVAESWITEQRQKIAAGQIQTTLLTDLSLGFRQFADLEP